jgi:hypothetical protein
MRTNRLVMAVAAAGLLGGTVAAAVPASAATVSYTVSVAHPPGTGLIQRCWVLRCWVLCCLGSARACSRQIRAGDR